MGCGPSSEAADMDSMPMREKGMVAFEVPVDDIKVKTKQPKAIPKPKSQDPKRLKKEIDEKSEQAEQKRQEQLAKIHQRAKEREEYMKKVMERKKANEAENEAVPPAKTGSTRSKK